MRRVILVILYFILLGVGIYEAYRGDWVVALFWAITCAGESIGVSIDNVARTMKGKGVL